MRCHSNKRPYQGKTVKINKYDPKTIIQMTLLDGRGSFKKYREWIKQWKQDEKATPIW